MILNDKQIKEEIVGAGYLPPAVRIGPASVDLSLGSQFSVLAPTEIIDLADTGVLSYLYLDAATYLLKPGEFILATTQEYVKVPPNMAVYVEGRSSIGRLGLQVQNAGFIDPGFHGQITLELANQTTVPIKIYAGMKMCQLVYFRLSEDATHPYKGKYTGQTGATPSRYWDGF